MGQYLKDEVQQAIQRAALEVFARKGFRSASVAEIAAAARISTGNVYRYFENKTALYQAVIPEELVATLRRLLRQRVEAARGVEDVRRLESSAPYRLMSEEVLAFCIQHRLQVVVLLAGSAGTEHEGFAEELSRSLVSAAIAHFRALSLASAVRFALDELYRNYVASLGRILQHCGEEREARAAVDALARYHLAGLKAFFEP